MGLLATLRELTNPTPQYDQKDCPQKGKQPVRSRLLGSNPPYVYFFPPSVGEEATTYARVSCTDCGFSGEASRQFANNPLGVIDSEESELPVHP